MTDTPPPERRVGWARFEDKVAAEAWRDARPWLDEPAEPSPAIATELLDAAAFTARELAQ